ncbi:YggU family protein [Enterobacteriaceae bacterium 89]|nr:YggU family protein [Enterobacteriaceae bacterium 89]
MSAVEHCEDGLVLRLYIQPKASRDSIVGLHGDELKVAITAPPVDGQANAHLVKFLAKQFRVAKSQVIIEKGELGRHKQIKIIHPQQLPSGVEALANQDIPCRK